MMASDTHLLAQSTSLTTRSLAMINGPQDFIGAVEDEWQLYSDRAPDYVIGSPIGFGASSIVYAATYLPTSPNSPPIASRSPPPDGLPCALKVLDLDSLPPRSLQLLQRETTLMSLSKHPNVLRVRGSWMEGHKLYIALRLMNKGSAADVMRYGWPGGMEEDVCRCILRQALKGLSYLHVNGFIHRDIKAANLLIDDDGTVLLGDLGVAADLAEDTSHPHSPRSTRSQTVTASAAVSPSRSPTSSTSGVGGGKVTSVTRPRMYKRKSFVGTPCWMAPELIQGRQYDASADIWSFGITALELTQGRPPRSRESPQKVLLKTIQEDPPTLDREGGTYRYSRAFKDVVDSCLAKDPAKRPTAAELLQTPFFKAAKKKSYLINTILKGLPPLTQRQERRVTGTINSPNSVDSWDFTTTINSPTTSIHRRRVLEDLVSAQEKEELQASGIFEMEEDYPGTSSPGNSRNISWGNSSIADVEEAELEPQIGPSMSSDSSTRRSSLTSTSSPPGTPTPSSSYTEPSEHDCESYRPTLAADLSPVQEPSSSIKGNFPIPPPDPSQPTISDDILVTLKRQSKRPSTAPSPSFSPSSDTPSSQRLWNTFKSNAKRSPSRTGKDNSSRKEKGRMGAIFESASKGLLSRSSSRSLAASKDPK